MIKLDNDGYIRLHASDFREIRMVHLVSGLAEDTEEEAAGSGGSASKINGYTEWVSTCTPVISLGWDWRLNVSIKPPVLLRENSPSSNVMLLDTFGRDVGTHKTAILLESVVDELMWQSTVLAAITRRYA